MYNYNIADLSEADRQHLEWLDANGAGGWAGSTITGCNTRRYHGLLVVAVPPAMQRMVLVSKLDETIISRDQRYELGTNNYGDTVYPQGYQYQQSFSKELYPEFLYEAGSISLKKTILTLHGENTTLVIYEALQSPGPFALQLSPLVAARDYHSLTHANSVLQAQTAFRDDTLLLTPYPGVPAIFIHAPGCSYTSQPCWYYHFNYPAEASRGLDFEEDLFHYGYFAYNMQQGQRLIIALSDEDPAGKDFAQLYRKEVRRRQAVVRGSRYEPLRSLLLAADQFMIRKPDKHIAIIAGYHWFTDWGRDTMIALPGLCIYSGRVSLAKKILQQYGHYISQGMIPNRFPDYSTAPEYNTVDGSLWMVIAAYHYYLKTRDKVFLKKSILPVIGTILEYYSKGTRYHIHADDDHLLYAGGPGVQLTWMDVKIGDRVVTPRTGKAVEINALWYNAWKIGAFLLKETGTKRKAEEYEREAENIRQSFRTLFWNESLQCLYDVVDGDQKDAAVRPNQLFTISLPYMLFEKDQAEKILSCISRELYTDKGLRSLSPNDKRYHPHYCGNGQQRDEAYHNGTVWSYLLGAYIDALVKVRGRGGRKAAAGVLRRFLPHLQEAGIGTISEIFDGDPPHAAKGCIAQAWSVGEILRVCYMYDLSAGSDQQEKRSSTIKVHHGKTSTATVERAISPGNRG